MPEANNKRVAKNTLFLYFRMILIMLVSFYTSRVGLAQLGISDFGIYNVTAGVVTMLSFLNSCMASSTQRYMTFELGRGDMQRLNPAVPLAFSSCRVCCFQYIPWQHVLRHFP